MARPTREPEDRPVTILRSGYFTDAQWRAAIEQAIQHGRTVLVVGPDGREERA